MLKPTLPYVAKQHGLPHTHLGSQVPVPVGEHPRKPKTLKTLNPIALAFDTSPTPHAGAGRFAKQRGAGREHAAIADALAGAILKNGMDGALHGAAWQPAQS